MADEIQVTGVEELIAKMQGLNRSVQGPIMRKAVTAGAKIVLEAAKSNVPVDEGLLKESLGIKVVSKPAQSTATAIVGPRKGYTDKATGKKMPTRYAHLVEKGHGGPSPAQPHPYLRPAIDNNVLSVEGAIADELRRGIIMAGGSA